jgi:tRNA(His) guanylyltransferase
MDGITEKMAISKEFMRHFGIIGLGLLYPKADKAELNRMQDEYEARRFLTTDSRDEMGDRLKAYETVETERRLDPALPIYARIDGRSFSRFTCGMRRPYDQRMINTMVDTTKLLVKGNHARIGYTQSDEISLVWLFDTPNSEPLFGGKVHKLTSVLASMATSCFLACLRLHFAPEEAEKLAALLPHFDARVFSLPTEMEAANTFLWRAMDARKNAVSQAARAVYSAKELHGKDQTAMRAMLQAKGIELEDYPACFKRGTFVRRVTFERAFTPEELVRIPEQHRPAPETLVTRSEVRTVPMPEFSKVQNRVEVIFDGAEPILGDVK